jgi:monofunctional biosynthetic peptidoglycan transglycosylase
MTKTKKNLVIAFLISDVIILIPVLFYFLIIPRNQIEGLVNKYVDVVVVKNEPQYTIVSRKPKNWKTLKEVNYIAAHAIVVSEDWGFYEHNGYDLNQMKEAVEDTVEDGKKLRGASTITQQVVKNLFLTNERSYIRKLKELSFSMYMERSLSKEKILEIYLNIIEYGEGIYGIKNASRNYFKKSPKSLTAREGAFLAMLLPSPKRYAQSFKEKDLTPFASKVVGSIIDKLARANYIKKEQVALEKARSFTWENTKMRPVKETKSNELKLKQTEIEDKVRVNTSKKSGKRRKKNREEDQYARDSSIEVSDEPSFDDDAIIEDNSGLEEEFSLE